MGAFQHALQTALDRFSTTFAEDEDMLLHDRGAPALSNNRRNAVVCRMGEKKVYLHYLQVATLSLRYMAQGDEQIDFGEYRTLLEETLGAR